MNKFELNINNQKDLRYFHIVASVRLLNLKNLLM